MKHISAAWTREGTQHRTHSQHSSHSRLRRAGSPADFYSSIYNGSLQLGALVMRYDAGLAPHQRLEPAHDTALKLVVRRREGVSRGPPPAEIVYEAVLESAVLNLGRYNLDVGLEIEHCGGVGMGQPPKHDLTLDDEPQDQSSSASSHGQSKQHSTQCRRT